MSDFWSRRRAAVAAEDIAEDQAVKARAEAAFKAEQAEKSDEQLLEELGLPDPGSLQPGDDVAGFMAKAVPDRLRRRALRQLWKLNPVLANVDGLVDYGEDFTDAATVVENLQTAYQVGKGMQAHIDALAAQAEPAVDDAETDADDAPDAGDEIAPVDETPVRAAAEADTPAPDPEPTQVTLEDEYAAPRPRRMRFEYDRA